MTEVCGVTGGVSGCRALSFLWMEATEGEGVAGGVLLERELVLWALPAVRGPGVRPAWEATRCLKAYPDTSAACADNAF